MANWALKIIGIGILMLVLAIPSKAQNTKGDKPTSSRESRFKKTVKKQKPAKRVRSKRTTSSLRAYKPRKKSRGGERAGRPVSPVNTSKPGERQSRNVYPQSGPYVNNKSRTPRDSQRKNTIPAQRRISARSASGRTRNVYPQSGPFVNRSSTADRKPPKRKKIVPRSASRSFIARKSVNAWAHFPRPKQKQERAYRGDISGRKIRTKNFETKRPAIIEVPRETARLRTPSKKNVYSRNTRFSRSPKRKSSNLYLQQGNYVSNYSRRPGRVRPIVSAPSAISRFQGTPEKKPGRKRKITPRSASGAYIARRSTNVWAHFPRPKHRSERAFTQDIAGRPLRTKNFETPRPDVISPMFKPRTKKRIGDRPYRGPSGRYATATTSGKGWRGDITGRKIRGRNYSSKRKVEGQVGLSPQRKRPGLDRFFKGRLKGGGFKSRSGERRTEINPVPVRPPGMGGKGINYQGTIKQRRGLNDQGEEYTGNIKSKRRIKGGGSVSGRLWNNRQSAISGKTPGIGTTGIGNYKGKIRQGKVLQNQGEEYSGHVKSRRPPKGGGSVSGRLWNNKQSAIPARTPGIGATGIENYKGRIKRGKIFQNQGEEYTGNIKARRPPKGGGSVSGRLWNNKQSAIPARTPGIGATGIENYKGKIKPGKIFQNQGEEYTGNIKARRPPKGGGSVSGRLWNNKQSAIPARTPGIGATGIENYKGRIKQLEGQGKGFQNQGEEYTGNIKARRPPKGGGSVSGKLWNNNETPIAGRLPTSDQGVESLGKLKIKQRPSGFRKNAPEGSLPGIRPTRESARASEYSRGIRRNWNYVRNPNSSDDALKIREPGKAFARASDYQGNIKMRKFDIFGRKGLHPDAQFVKINKNNVASEKSMVTNFKLWWSRLFRKNDTQPDHLKDKRGKPRYDKGEQGLWYD